MICILFWLVPRTKKKEKKNKRRNKLYPVNGAAVAWELKCKNASKAMWSTCDPTKHSQSHKWRRKQGIYCLCYAPNHFAIECVLHFFFFSVPSCSVQSLQCASLSMIRAWFFCAQAMCAVVCVCAMFHLLCVIFDWFKQWTAAWQLRSFSISFLHHYRRCFLVARRSSLTVNLCTSFVVDFWRTQFHV